MKNVHIIDVNSFYFFLEKGQDSFEYLVTFDLATVGMDEKIICKME